MIINLVSRLTDRIIRENYTSEDMREWYEYVFLRMIETFLSMITVFLIGAISGQILPVCVFTVSFLSLRKRTGGYHFDKFWKCYTVTGLSMIGVEIFETILRDNLVVIYGLFFAAVIITAVVGAVNHPNMNMSFGEFQKSRRLARTVLTVESVAVILMEFMGAERIYINYLILSIVYCAVLIVISKLKNQEVKVYEQ